MYLLIGKNLLLTTQVKGQTRNEFDQYQSGPFFLNKHIPKTDLSLDIGLLRCQIILHFFLMTKNLFQAILGYYAVRVGVIIIFNICRHFLAIQGVLIWIDLSDTVKKGAIGQKTGWDLFHGLWLEQFWSKEHIFLMSWQ